MLRKTINLGSLILASTLGGCAGVPDLNLVPLADQASESGESANGKVNRVINRIICELNLAKAARPDLARYVGVAQLSLKVEDTGGLTPSLSIINPLAVAGTSRSGLLGGEFTRGRLRSFTQNFTSRERTCQRHAPSEQAAI